MWINGRIFSMTIDNGSSAKVVSTYALEKLEILCTNCKANYKLQWLNEYGEVSKQCMLSFSIGVYSEEVFVML